MSAVGIHFRHPNSPAEDYVGRFLSSDNKLNKIWYQGAYTNDTNSVPIGAVPGQTIPVILDGAKRDRRPWSGDLDLQGRTAFTSLGFGPRRDRTTSRARCGLGSRHADARRTDLRRRPELDGGPPTGGFYSTGVLDLLPRRPRRQLPLHRGPRLRGQPVQPGSRREMNYNLGLTNASLRRPHRDDHRQRRPRLGLLRRRARGHRDRDQRACTTEPSASPPGWPVDLIENGPHQRRRRHVGQPDKAAWEARAGAGQGLDQRHIVRPGARRLQDVEHRHREHRSGNAVAAGRELRWPCSGGVAPQDKVAGILSWLEEQPWGDQGPQPFSPEANNSTLISPHVTGFELAARFEAGNTEDALTLNQEPPGRGWRTRPTPSTPGRSGRTHQQNGDLTRREQEPRAQLVQWPDVEHVGRYLLGVKPVEPGFKTWNDQAPPRRPGLEPGPRADTARRAAPRAGSAARVTARSS